MKTTLPGRLGTVLSIWAHPDDETYLAGGLMAVAAAGGQRVVCVSATAGEHGTDDPHTWPPERLGAVRRGEAAAALAELGVSEQVWLDYSDGTLVELDSVDPVERIACLIDEVRPDTILTFGPDGVTFHPDHIAVGGWTKDAWNRCGGRSDLLCAVSTVDHFAVVGELFEDVGVYMTDQRPRPMAVEDVDVHLVVGGAELDRKVRALAAMPSQTAALNAAVGDDGYRMLVSTEAFVAIDRFPTTDEPARPTPG